MEIVDSNRLGLGSLSLDQQTLDSLNKFYKEDEPLTFPSPHFLGLGVGLLKVSSEDSSFRLHFEAVLKSCKRDCFLDDLSYAHYVIGTDLLLKEGYQGFFSDLNNQSNFILSLGRAVYNKCKLNKGINSELVAQKTKIKAKDFKELAEFLQVRVLVIQPLEEKVKSYNSSLEASVHFLMTPSYLTYLCKYPSLPEAEYNSKLFCKLYYTNSLQFRIDYLKNKADCLDQKNTQLQRQNSQLSKICMKVIKANINSMDPGKLKKITEDLKKFSSNSRHLEQLERFLEIRKCDYCLQHKNFMVLECGHKVCFEDLIEVVASATDNKMILNNFEKTLYEEPKCPVYCPVMISRETILAVLGDKFNYYQSLAFEREAVQNPRTKHCNLCKTDQYLENFEEGFCGDICSGCIVACLRIGRRECPVCVSEFPEKSVRAMMLRTNFCVDCKQEKTLIKEFIGKTCEAHDIVCIECLEKTLKLNFCRPCMGYIDEGFKIKLNLAMHRECWVCHNPYSRSEPLEQKNCFCGVCSECQRNDIEKCLFCEERLPEEVTRDLDLRNALKKAKESLKQFHCSFCNLTVDIKDIYMGKCTHGICANCMKKYMEAYLNCENFDKLGKCPECEEDTFEDRVQRFIELNPQFEEIYSSVMISSEFTLISCPNCRTPQEPSEHRMNRCLKCDFLFCKNCQKSWHGEEDCFAAQIEEDIRAMEEAGLEVAQCPGCKHPYSKREEGCSHVVCVYNKCKMEFCFQCSCIRSPTLAHGNHYHRPECPFYSPQGDFEDEFLPQECSECKKLGDLCVRPQSLIRRCRFAQGER